MAFDDLVDRIATREQGLDADLVGPEHYDAVYVSLYLTHIPALIDAGLVAYDADTRRVALTDRGHRLAPLDVHRTGHAFWNRAVLAQSLVWIVVVLAAWIGMAPFERLPAFWIVGGCLGTHVLTSIGYAWLTRCRTRRDLRAR